MPTIMSTGLIFLFWSILSIGAIRFLIKAIIPKRIRKSFSKLGSFILNLVCDNIESYSKVAYNNFTEKRKERREFDEESDDESILEGLDEETVKYNNAVAGNKVTSSGNIIHHNFKKKRSQLK